MELKDAEYQDWKEDNTKILAEDWWLKPMLVESSVFCYDKGSNISDFKKVGRDVRVVGTELQLYNLFCKMSDEKGWQVKDEWQTEVKDQYLDLYMKNSLQPIIINLI